MIKFNNIHYELYIIIILLAFAYFALTNFKIAHLLAIIIIIIIAIFIYYYLDNLSNNKDINVDYKENTLDNDIKDRDKIFNENYYLYKFPKKIKYLKEDDMLVDIITNIRFTILFNKSRYTDIILNMEKLMKIYIYILADRYDANTYIPIFIDIRNNIIEMLYSMFLLVPNSMKYTYNLNPHQELYKSIDDFILYSRELLETIEKYAVIHKKKVYIPDTKYRTYNSTSVNTFP
jgi:hypothetical protein